MCGPPVDEPPTLEEFLMSVQQELQDTKAALADLVAAAESYHGCGEDETNPLKESIERARKELKK